jgi:hypothetical protein
MFYLDGQPAEVKSDQKWWKNIRYQFLRASTDCFNQNKFN